jgi:hypothetical protein
MNAQKGREQRRVFRAKPRPARRNNNFTLGIGSQTFPIWLIAPLHACSVAHPIWHNLPHVRAISTLAEKAGSRGIFRLSFRRTRLEPPLQHCPQPVPVIRQHPKEIVVQSRRKIGGTANVQPAPKRAELTIQRMRRRINSNSLTQNLLWWPSGLLCGVNPDDRADLGGHKESLYPNPNGVPHGNF